ncbi:unnamed protein product, partial [Mesorhabditis spiculigera]
MYSAVLVLLLLRLASSQVCDTETKPKSSDIVTTKIVEDSSSVFYNFDTNSTDGEAGVGSIFYQPSTNLPPLGYNETDYTLTCAQNEGNCGADMPIYRMFKLTANGVEHAYSFQNTAIDGYAIELTPLCWGWNRNDTLATIVKRQADMDQAPDEDSCVDDGNLDLTTLSEYVNTATGPTLNHITSTVEPGSTTDGNGYTKVQDLGYVSKNQAACGGCLTPLVQKKMVQTGLAGIPGFDKYIIDYKLSAPDEADRFLESYTDTGETIYCATQKGQCGADTPIWKVFDFVNIDSRIITNDTILPLFTYKYPFDPLCYIWSKDLTTLAAGTTTTTVANSATSDATDATEAGDVENSGSGDSSGDVAASGAEEMTDESVVVSDAENSGSGSGTEEESGSGDGETSGSGDEVDTSGSGSASGDTEESVTQEKEETSSPEITT